MNLKAGPPICPICGEIEQIWIPAKNKDIIPPYKPFLWICPNYCNIKSFTHNRCFVQEE